VDHVLDELRGLAPDPVISSAARTVIDHARQVILAGYPAPGYEDILSSVRELVARGTGRGLEPVINATGVLIHTNLGRAPLGDVQMDAIQKVGRGYSNLEFDLAIGKRGHRYEHSRRALATLTGAESALVVNNNAAAVLLTLSALCEGREVIISRGELIEIGGEFRIPEVMAISGARLVEVGTTNRTHLSDYERAITPDTGAILKVHPSNYQVVGFTSSVPPREIARLAQAKDVCFIHDLGSGLVDVPPSAPWAASEPSIKGALEEGADLVTFSGDKLFGGPQAGIVAGRRDLIQKLQRDPLMRALRVDKVTLAALEATADAYLRNAWDELPLWAMALAPEADLHERAERIAGAVASTFEPEGKVEATRVMSVAGGGSVPGSQIPSWGIAISGLDANALQSKLREGTPPLIARVADDRVVLDMRTIDPAHDDLVVECLRTRIIPKGL
jgi:L-seryl-tRNA(Ser) seleniumtransferase